MTGGVARGRRAHIVLFAVAVAVQLPGLLWGAPGGKTINNALRILDGDVPYRDFWTMYAPGSFYLGALLFRIFGRHIWVLGVASMVLVALHAVIASITARRLGASRRAALIVALMFVGIGWRVRREIHSYDTALVPLLLAVDRMVCYGQGRGARMLIPAGLLLGIAAWFKHDLAMYVAVGTVVGFSGAWWLGKRESGWLPPFPMAARLALSALVGLAPMAVYIAWYAGADAWRDLIVFPATDFPIVRGEGYPRQLPDPRWVTAWLADPGNAQRAQRLVMALTNWTMGVAPEIVFIGAVLLLLRRWRQMPAWIVAMALAALTAMPFFWTAAHVQQNTHLISMWLCSALLIALLARAPDVSRVWRAAAMSLFVVYCGAQLVPAAASAAEAVHLWPSRRVLAFPAVAGVRIPERTYSYYQPIASYIRAHVPESEPIYVGLVRHDSIVISNQTFYYLAGRRVASRYNELHPGIADRDEVQQEIIDDINRLGVRCAVLWDFGWPQAQLNQILASRRRELPELGATRLDAFFREEFEEVFRRGEFILVWRKGVRRPT